MDGGAWWVAVHGVMKSRTRLSNFTFTFHFHALEKKMAIHSSVLAWRISGMGEPGGLPSMEVTQSWTWLKQLSSSSRGKLQGGSTLGKVSFFSQRSPERRSAESHRPAVLGERGLQYQRRDVDSMPLQSPTENGSTHDNTKSVFCMARVNSTYCRISKLRTGNLRRHCTHQEVLHS